MARLHLIERAARKLTGEAPVPAPEALGGEPATQAYGAESALAPPATEPPGLDGVGPASAGLETSRSLAEHAIAALREPMERAPAAAPLVDGFGALNGAAAPVGDAVLEADGVGSRRLGSPPPPLDRVDRTAVPAAPATPAHIIDLDALEQAGMVVGRKARTRISEEFRVSVGHVLRTMRSAKAGHGMSNLLMVTSARPGEGKSFSAVNLAASIAQHGLREVMLVDMDAKQRSISAMLGLSDHPGLLDLSNNPAMRPEEVIIRTVVNNLSIVPIGALRNDSQHAFTLRPINAVIERLARRFPNHVLLLDSPPCLSTSDPSTVAPLVGQVVMVVEAERTQRSELEASLDLVKACPHVTLLLNKIKLTTSHTFGAYHYFGTYA